MSETSGSNRAEALVFGEALWDLLPSGAVLGGAPLNFAYRLGSLGVPTRLVSQVGDDDLGAKTLARMSSLGMNTSLVTVSGHLPTATVVVELDQKRQPTYTIVRDVAYDAIPWSPALEEAAVGADILCFGTLAQRDLRSRATLRKVVRAFTGRTVLVDINLRRDCWNDETVRWSLEHGTIAKLNDEELLVLAGIYGVGPVPPAATAADRAPTATTAGDPESPGADPLSPADTPPSVEAIGIVAEAVRLAAGLQTIVVTRGAAGAVAVTAGLPPVSVPGYTVAVDDPCGAGDAFAGMFMASIVEGRPIREAMTRANALGALVATQPGATQPVALEEVERLIAGDQPGAAGDNSLQKETE